MSTSFLSSSSTRIRRASGTFTVRASSSLGQHVLQHLGEVVVDSLGRPADSIMSNIIGVLCGRPRPRPPGPRAGRRAASGAASRASACGAPPRPRRSPATLAARRHHEHGARLPPAGAADSPARGFGVGAEPEAADRAGVSSARCLRLGVDLVFALGAHHVDRARRPGRAPWTRRRGRRSRPR